MSLIKITMKSYAIKILVIIFISLLLASCGGGGEEREPASKIINGINVPADPGEVGKTTLEGIDSNNNGVRDDIEIMLAQEYGNDKEKYDIAFEQAVIVQKLFNTEQTRDVETMSAAQLLSKAYRCSSDENREIFKKVKSEYFNTQDRQAKRQELMAPIPILPRRGNCD